MRERALETAPRLDRRADDDELGSALVRDPRDLLAKQTGARANDLAPHADAVRRRDRGRHVEPLTQRAQVAVEPRVERQLAIDEERRDEDDARVAVGGKPARQIERVLRFLLLEERHDDRAIADRACAAREHLGTATEEAKVGASHRTSG